MMRVFFLLWVQFRASLIYAMQYRLDFFLDLVVEVFWGASAVLPLVAAFQGRTQLAGYSIGEALFVSAWFTWLQALLEGVIHPSLLAVVEHIRKGTLDFVLLKPIDAQFLVSTAKIQPARAVHFLSALLLFGVGAHALERPISVLNVLFAILLGIAGAFVLYFLAMLAVSLAFVVVKVDNLTFLFSAIFDAARWPASVFRGALRLVFTFIIPLFVMTTYPAHALSGRLAVDEVLITALTVLAFGWLSRRAWTGSLARYTSAGG